MLVELIVENYAVVEQIRARFHHGLNLLTGETGSGKSIVVDSLGLLFGARASSEAVRTGADKARISGIFSAPSDPALDAILHEAGLELEDGEILIEREILANGKSRAFVASRPVTTAFLKQLAPFLGDIHGQHEQQILFSHQAQRDMLDQYAQAGELRAAVAMIHERWRATAAQLEELNKNEQEKMRLLDLWTFQRKEIETVQPKPGEEEELASERLVLQNVTKLQENAEAAYEILYESQESVVSQMGHALRRMEELTRIDAHLTETLAALKPAEIAIEEAARDLRDYLGKLEGDPARLEEVETRLAAIDRLKRKYGGSIPEILSFLDQVNEQIDSVEHANERRAELEQEREKLGKQYQAAAAKLSKLRREAAAKLSRQVETELNSLAMGGTVFQIQLREGPWSATGIDEIEFLVSPNRGEEPKPLEKIASGGELSRIALALKTAIGITDQSNGVRTLVFDEVDAGVGGAAAASVGRRLKALAKSNQVLCVTHLAQIAGFADHHYAVSKREKKGRIATALEELTREQRAQEIGRMLSGEQVTAEALKQAEQLMQMS